MIKRKGVLEYSFGRIGQLIMLNNVVGDAAKTRQFSGLVPDTTVIFEESDVTHVMQSPQCPRMAPATTLSLAQKLGHDAFQSSHVLCRFRSPRLSPGDAWQSCLKAVSSVFLTVQGIGGEQAIGLAQLGDELLDDGDFVGFFLDVTLRQDQAFGLSKGGDDLPG